MPVDPHRVSCTPVAPTSWLIDNTELPLDNRSFRHGNPKFHTPFAKSCDSSLHAHDRSASLFYDIGLQSDL